MTRLGLLLLGLVTGFAGVVLHQSWLWLAVAGVAGVAILVATPARLRVWWAAGFGAAPIVFSLPRGEGDVVLSGTPSIVLACLAALWIGIGIAGVLPAPRTRAS